MAKINLLPWRDRLREKSKKEFIQASGLAAIIGALIIFIWGTMLGLQIENQSSRNEMLKTEIAKLDKDIAEIDGLKKQRALLVDRMKVIQGLQSNRPFIVHIFEELVKTLPDGVYYTSISRTGNTISLKGKAESNEEVSALMRKLDASDYFKSPLLSGVTEEKSKNKDGTEQKSSVFALQILEEDASSSTLAPSANKSAAK